jgi:hypothetical protein
MWKKYKYLIFGLFFLLALALAWWTGMKTSLWQKYEAESSTVLLNKIERVVKLIAVEGNVSEIYDYKDYYNFDLAPFRKKALVRVNAKVSVGYDFEKVAISANEENKTIVMRNFPEAEILSIDHDLDYYDISQGTFNRFNNEDYNKINSRAKEYVEKKALESDLMDAAEQQKEEIIEMIRILVQSAGWTLQVEDGGTFLD